MQSLNGSHRSTSVRFTKLVTGLFDVLMPWLDSLGPRREEGVALLRSANGKVQLGMSIEQALSEVADEAKAAGL